MKYTIDGSTTTGASCGTLVTGSTHTLLVILDGVSLPSSVNDGLTITATDCIIRGLVVQNCPDMGILSSGDGFTIECCYIGTDNTGTSSAGNGDDGLFISGSTTGVNITNNLFSGNTESGFHSNTNSEITVKGNLIGTNAAGTSVLANAHGITGFGIKNSVFGGSSASDRNVISGNTNDGFNGGATGTTNNTFKGNYIGVDITGEVDLGNGGDGIDMFANNSYIIGGTAAGEGNVISGNGGYGLVIKNSNTLEGNFIGTDKDGDTNIGNDLGGIRITTTNHDNTIGGNSSASENVIAFNTGDGISLLTTAGVNNAILRNQIFSNTESGIDLGNDGVDTNDSGDADSGCNNLQNSPEISSSIVDGSNNVTATYLVASSASNSTYPITVRFFKADAGNEEGQTYLGEHSYTSGNAENSVTTTFWQLLLFLLATILLPRHRMQMAILLNFQAVLFCQLNWFILEEQQRKIISI